MKFSPQAMLEFCQRVLLSYYDGPSVCTHTMQEAKLVLCITIESLKKHPVLTLHQKRSARKVRAYRNQTLTQKLSHRCFRHR
jgi:hypothetical protein